MRSADQRKQAVFVLSVVGVIVAAVFGTFAWQKLTRPNIGTDNCLYEDKRFLRKKTADQTVVAIDQSEDLSPSHKRQIKELLLDYIVDDTQLPVRAGVLLYVFGKNDFSPTGAGQDLKPLVNVCRPPSSGNEVIENKRKIEKTFHGRFINPLYQSIDQSLNLSLGERSPILEMLQYLSRTQDVKEGSPGASPTKRLILVSDMLQHSTYLSHYKGHTYDDFLRSAQMLKADLRGWTVRILYLQRYGRDQRLQNPQLLEFWMRYFYEAGAKVETFTRVP